MADDFEHLLRFVFKHEVAITRDRVTHRAAARLIGVHSQTLHTLVGVRRIKRVRIPLHGSQFSYWLSDIAAFLESERPSREAEDQRRFDRVYDQAVLENQRFDRRSPEHAARKRATDVARNRLKRSGYDDQTYRAMVAEQDGKCFICGCACDSGKALAADHCHVTGIIRRPLCMKCNLGLGAALDQPWILERSPPAKRYFRNDPELIKRAIDYLERFREAETQNSSNP